MPDQTKRVRGVVRKLGLEGGLWSLVTTSGETFELLDAPTALKQDGLHVEVNGTVPADDDVGVGMLGGAICVTGYAVLAHPRD